MTVQPPSHEVKRIVTRTFFELGVASSSLFAVQETVLRERGHCVARTYWADRLKAHWDVYEGRVEFFNEAGHLVHTVNLLAETVPHLVAA